MNINDKNHIDITDRNFHLVEVGKDGQRTLDANLDGHIVKPIDIAALKKVLIKMYNIFVGGENDEGQNKTFSCR